MMPLFTAYQVPGIQPVPLTLRLLQMESTDATAAGHPDTGS